MQLTVPRFTSRTIGVRIGAVRPVATTEYFSQEPHDMPVGIVDLGIPGVQVGPLPAQVPSTCRSDLVTVDGSPVPVRLRGSVADARARKPLDVATCDGGPVALGKGQRSLRTAAGLDTGIDLDTVQLGSDPGGAAARLAATTPVPSITVDRTGKVSYRVTVDKATAPFWLVLGQSLSQGWKATVEGGPSLGEPTLVDGFANGWRVDPAATGSSFVVDLEWAPQKVVRAATWVSGLWFLGVLGLLGPAVVATPTATARGRDRRGRPRRPGSAASCPVPGPPRRCAPVRGSPSWPRSSPGRGSWPGSSPPWSWPRSPRRRSGPAPGASPSP